ncbi:Vancomycin B-type resistance protein VanW [Sporotomaculum syntrophicum]|uniref:Vancomycin B-type resistance protein VanW n=1 Tax=Sporotomaculum syntrophicum TaxID=182264 RepID=A0A9D2WNP4_9FIRM|nr:VanW family protein [Sporotomaculum syntrophicum]KAF1083827.1 Vancomycin B-type resistance protein VanW [Sporotomaculum syntrophicum]
MAPRKKNKYKLIRFGLLLLLFLALGVIATAMANDNCFSNPNTATDILPPGTTVLGVDLSKLSKQAAMTKLLHLEQQLQKQKVKIAYQGTDHEVTLGALGLSLNASKTIDQVLENANQMGIIKRWQARLHLIGQQPAVINLDRNKVKSALQTIVNPLYIPAMNAGPTVNSQGQVMVQPAKDGFRVEIDQFTKQLLEMINSNNDLSLELTTAKIKPELSTEEVTKWNIKEMIAQYTTRFNSALTGRTQNIKIAADVLDGLVVAPGEIISFNDVVGPREVDKGYQNAGIIVGNTLTEGIGGGICQVATTLYNAVLLADLDIVQRGNHNIPISYAPIGLDAAVSYGSLDLKFKNNTGSHMLIKTSVEGNYITVRIYGNNEKGKNIQLKSWVTETIEPKVVYKVDPSLEPEQSKELQKGASGYRAQAQRIVTVNGKVEQEALPSSYYLPVEQIIAVQSETQIPGHEPVEEPQEEEPDEEPENETTGDSADPGPTPDRPEIKPGIPLPNSPAENI